jgi:CheY-like chemotaxis protein
MTGYITVIVADDHPVYRTGVVRALKESGTVRVVAEASDGRAALAAIREHKPAVALVDYKMPELDGLDVVNAVARDDLPTHVILLSAFDDAPLVYKALSAGASGYLTKESDSADIPHRVTFAEVTCLCCQFPCTHPHAAGSTAMRQARWACLANSSASCGLSPIQKTYAA